MDCPVDPAFFRRPIQLYISLSFVRFGDCTYINTILWRIGLSVKENLRWGIKSNNENKNYIMSHLYLLLKWKCYNWLAILNVWGKQWRSWLRHWAASREVAGSNSDGVTGIFHRHNPSSRTRVLGLTQSLTEMNTRTISWGVKVAGALGWQPYHSHVPIVFKSGSLTLLEPSGPVQPCNGIALPLPLYLLNVWIVNTPRKMLYTFLK